MKNKIQRAIVNFWRDERGVGETADRAIWLVLGIGAATVAAFGVVGGIRGRVGGTVGAMDATRAVSVPITGATTGGMGTLGTNAATGIAITATPPN